MSKKLIILVLLIGFFSSCRVLRPSSMLKATKADSLTNMTNSSAIDYKIAPNDIVEFSMVTNGGSKLIDIGIAEGGNVKSKNLPYNVEADGFIRLPVIGRIFVSGLTIKEATAKIEDSYSKYYVEPFVILTVINRRVIVFPGTGGSAKVIPFQNDNMTLIETIALAGGIAETGKAYRIRLIRRTGGKMQMQLIDLSTLAGMPEANIVMQANDILYVEPTARIPEALLNKILPYISLFTTFVLIYSLVKPK